MVELVTTRSLTAVHALPRLRLERRQLDDDVVASEHAHQPLLEPVRIDRGKEADAPEIDADHGDRRAEEALECAQHRPVATQHHGEVGL